MSSFTAGDSYGTTSTVNAKANQGNGQCLRNADDVYTCIIVYRMLMINPLILQYSIYTYWNIVNTQSKTK
jgi:hypothetical protein